MLDRTAGNETELTGAALREAKRALRAQVIAARDLTAKVIRVDDFPQDLGLSEMQAAYTEAAAPAAVVHKAAA